jgi:hypothetical protein
MNELITNKYEMTERLEGNEECKRRGSSVLRWSLRRILQQPKLPPRDRPARNGFCNGKACPSFKVLVVHRVPYAEAVSVFAACHWLFPSVSKLSYGIVESTNDIRMQ